MSLPAALQAVQAVLSREEEQRRRLTLFLDVEARWIGTFFMKYP